MSQSFDFFFPVWSIHTIWKRKSVLHPMGMHSYVLGNYALWSLLYAPGVAVSFSVAL